MDPRDAKILALTTKLEKVEQEGTTKPNAVANATDGKTPGGEKKFNPLEEWRKKFDGDSKEVNGRTYWWCKNHKTKDYDGLYVSSHTPVNHDAWSKDKRDRIGKYRSTTAVNATDSRPKEEAPKSTLGLNDRLRNVLMTNVCLSSEDIDKIFQAASQEN